LTQKKAIKNLFLKAGVWHSYQGLNLDLIWKHLLVATIAFWIPVYSYL